MSEVKLYHGDCLEVMRGVADKSVDMILCDLPYGTTSCSWDVIIPFDKLWEQYNRVIKDNGAIVLFGSQPFTSLLITSNISKFREELIWVKNKCPSGLLGNKRHLKCHENIIIFSKETLYTYNPITWNVDEDFIIKRKCNEIFVEKNNIIGSNNKGRIRKIDDGSRLPISILPFKVPYSPKSKSKTKNGDYRLHPTQKPTALLEYLVKTYTNENETVLDNCMGSGSTGVACINTNRNFIGIELDDNYFKIAEDRINKAKESIFDL